MGAAATGWTRPGIPAHEQGAEVSTCTRVGGSGVCGAGVRMWHEAKRPQDKGKRAGARAQRLAGRARTRVVRAGIAEGLSPSAPRVS